MSIEFQKPNSDRPRIVVYEQRPNSKFRLRVLYLQLVMMAGRCHISIKIFFLVSVYITNLFADSHEMTDETYYQKGVAHYDTGEFKEVIYFF